MIIIIKSDHDYQEKWCSYTHQGHFLLFFHFRLRSPLTKNGLVRILNGWIVYMSITVFWVQVGQYHVYFGICNMCIYELKIEHLLRILPPTKLEKKTFFPFWSILSERHNIFWTSFFDESVLNLFLATLSFSKVLFIIFVKGKVFASTLLRVLRL